MEQALPARTAAAQNTRCNQGRSVKRAEQGAYQSISSLLYGCFVVWLLITCTSRKQEKIAETW
jgi:hypothetical protein